MQHKVWLSWSSGKDSAYALYKLKQQKEFVVTGIFSVIVENSNCVSLHGTPKKLLEKQSKQLGIPLHIINIPSLCSSEMYAATMQTFLKDNVINNGIFHIAFGDIFLEDVRNHRERQLSKLNVRALFPLWHQNSLSLAHEIIESKIEAIVTFVDRRKLDSSFLDRKFDEQFLSDLPAGIDPCGENGEFHTLVINCPMFKQKIDFRFNNFSY